MKRPASDLEDGAARKRPSAADGALGVARRPLGTGELVVGGAWFGVGPAGNPENLSQQTVDAAVVAAYAAGIREFDTAPWYGAGSGEERLGRALRTAGLVADCRVTTKVGRLFREPDGSTPCGPGYDEPGRAPLEKRICSNDYTGAGAERSFKESLARMGLEGVHAMRIHDPNDNSCNDGSVDEVAICVAEGGACEGLRNLRADGVIKHVGLGMNCNREAHIGVPEQVVRLLTLSKPGTFDSALLAGGWNLLSQAGLPCLLECQRQGVEVHVAGVYASGLLVGGATYAYKEAPKEMVDKRDCWRELADKHQVSLAAVAIAFAWLPTCVTRVVIGMATEEQVRQNLAWVEESAKVPSAIFAEAKTLGLLGPDVPLPP